MENNNTGKGWIKLFFVDAVLIIITGIVTSYGSMYWNSKIQIEKVKLDIESKVLEKKLQVAERTFNSASDFYFTVILGSIPIEIIKENNYFKDFPILQSLLEKEIDKQLIDATLGRSDIIKASKNFGETAMAAMPFLDADVAEAIRKFGLYMNDVTIAGTNITQKTDLIKKAIDEYKNIILIFNDRYKTNITLKGIGKT